MQHSDIDEKDWEKLDRRDCGVKFCTFILLLSLEFCLLMCQISSVGFQFEVVVNAEEVEVIFKGI